MGASIEIHEHSIQLPDDARDGDVAHIDNVTAPFLVEDPEWLPLAPARIVTLPDRRMLAFAKDPSRTIFEFFLGVDLATGKVFRFDESDRVLQFANTGLAAYSECATIFYRGAPYNIGDQDGHEHDEITVACELLMKTFEEIDPPCLAPASFWVDYISDVDMGNWDEDSL